MFVILVSGASGSGKTTIVDLLKEKILEYKIDCNVSVISMDQYYYSMDPGYKMNWDDISSINVNALVETIYLLKNGHAVNIPDYDYITHQTIPNAYCLSKVDVLIVEGIFTLYDRNLCEMADLKIYIDADPIKTCFARRFHRDGTERRRSGESVIKQYFDQVLPGYEKFVLSAKKYADICYINEGDFPGRDMKFINIVTNYIFSS